MCIRAFFQNTYTSTCYFYFEVHVKMPTTKKRHIMQHLHISALLGFADMFSVETWRVILIPAKMLRSYAHPVQVENVQFLQYIASMIG